MGRKGRRRGEERRGEEGRGGEGRGEAGKIEVRRGEEWRGEERLSDIAPLPTTLHMKERHRYVALLASLANTSN